MAGRKVIINFLLVLLLSLGSSYYNANAQYSSSNTLLTTNTLSGPTTPRFFFCKHIVQKDLVKVRYIGGEYSYEVATVPLYITTARAACSKAFPGKSFIALSNEHLLFKLRGPPSPFVCWC